MTTLFLNTLCAQVQMGSYIDDEAVKLDTTPVDYITAAIYFLAFEVDTSVSKVRGHSVKWLY